MAASSTEPRTETGRTAPAAALVGLVVLVAACYGGAIAGRRQFALRDASHFYYPLHLRVQQEWAAGRFPLWEPEENGGAPLLGDPTAAVLYPLKVIFALLPYPDAARWYVITHTMVAFATMTALARHWGLGHIGSSIAALSYAFGAPVLFLHCNIIYLVGAAWSPLALRATDRWIRGGRYAALIELCLVLALMVLGGDPEAAYLCVVAAVGYAVILAWPARSDLASVRRPWIVGGLGLAVWALLAVCLAKRLPASKTTALPTVFVGVLAFAAFVALYAFRRRSRPGHLLRMMIGLVGASILGLTLTGIQTIPVAEAASLSIRAADPKPYGLYEFEIEPYQAAEWLWPNVLGSFVHGERY
jgi:hypothetical protein